MNTQPIQFDVVSEFKGQVSNTDPADCPPETVFRQLNLMCVTPGLLTTRGGLKEITLDTLE